MPRAAGRLPESGPPGPGVRADPCAPGVRSHGGRHPERTPLSVLPCPGSTLLGRPPLPGASSRSAGSGCSALAPCAACT